MTPLRHSPTLSEIVAAASETTGVAVAEIRSKSRVPEIAFARHIAWAAARAFPAHGFTCSEIGEFFGVDSSAILYAVRGIQRRATNDSSIDAAIRDTIAMVAIVQELEAGRG